LKKKFLPQFFDIINNSFIISITDPNGIITYVNKKFEEISGYSKEELIGKPHSIIRHPDVSKKVFENMWQTILKGKTWEGILKNKRKDAKAYYVYSVIAPIKEKDKIVSFISIKQDITKLIETRKKLAQEKALFAHTLNNTNNMILIRKNNKPFLANKAFLKFFNLKNIKEFREKYKFKNLLLKDCIHKIDFNKPLKKPIKVCLESKNQKKYFLLFISTFKLSKNQYSILTLNDITELEIARQKAEESQKLKTQFLANISHELRTPLTSIIGYTELLEQTNLNEKQKKYLNIIKESSNTMLNILNTILDFSKIEANKLELNIEPNNLYLTIIKVFNTLKPLAEKKDLNFLLEIKTSKECFKFDELRLTQILTNLINNAIKFTNKGEVKVILERDLTFRIIDTGKGIPKNKIDDIFKAYIQSDKKDQYQGTGLGLPITKKLIELMGGKLKIKSKINKGSEFYFKLPLKECNKKRLKEKINSVKTNEKEIAKFLEQFEIDTKNGNLTISTTPPADIVIEKTPNYLYELYYKLYNLEKKQEEKIIFKNEKVLLVEDNEFNIHLFKEILQKLGLFVDIAKNGQEAIDKALNNDYKLLLMDVNMPKLNGIKASKQIKKKKNIPIIALTAHILPEEKEKILETMDDIITKPINITQLQNILKKYIPTAKNIITKIVKKFDFSYEEAKNLVDIFIKNTQESINTLEKAIKEQNKEEIYKALHNLKGSSGYFDEDGIYKIAFKNLKKIKKEKIPDIKIIKELQEALNKFKF